MDEDYMTATPFTVNDSIFITYVEDKDAGGYPYGEGSLTYSPVRCWVFWKGLIGIEEHDIKKPNLVNMIVSPNPMIHNTRISYTLHKSGIVTLKLYDATGRLVRNLDNDYKEAGEYILNVNTDDLANGMYFVILNTSFGESSRTNLVFLK